MAVTKEEHPARETTTITVTRDFGKRVRQIADHRDITMAEVLEQFGESIYREHKKVMREMNAEYGGES